jgi:CxxC motif-containing protein (DUF1111 family)
LQEVDDSVRFERGQEVFEEIECAKCHVPEMEGANGPVPVYSDLLLHEILPSNSVGIEEASANMWEFRTAPLWGLSQTAPYMHDGRADTIQDAILLHHAEGTSSRIKYQTLGVDDASALLYFLGSL